MAKKITRILLNYNLNSKITNEERGRKNENHYKSNYQKRKITEKI